VAKDTAERILDAAHTLISDGGYAAFSYADISSVVKVSKATIHHHFPAKEDLVVAVLRRHRARLGEGLSMVTRSGAKPIDQLAGYIRYWEACIRKKTEPLCIAALLGAELPSLPKDVAMEVRLHFVDLHAWLRQILELGAKQKSIRLKQTAADEAEVLLATVHGAMISARAYQSSEVFGQIMNATLQRLSTSA
jgi:TetR/AcrR family transcriptional repressor of nem operon